MVFTDSDPEMVSLLSLGEATQRIPRRTPWATLYRATGAGTGPLVTARGPPLPIRTQSRLAAQAWVFLPELTPEFTQLVVLTRRQRRLHLCS